jgi:anti-sigma B factor antagonist
VSPVPPQGFSVHVTTHATGITAAVSGELDIATSGVTYDQVAPLITGEPGGELTLELGEVTFCDSAGINALVALRKQCDSQGWFLRVVNLQPGVRRVLVDFTGLGDYLNVT